MLKILSILLLLCGSWAQAADLVWNASVVDEQHAAPDGYRIHWGSEPGVYTGQADAGLALTWHIPDDWYGSYYFSASAYIGTVSSGYSNEVIFTRDQPQQHIGATAITASKLQHQSEPQMAVAQSGTLASYTGGTGAGNLNFTVPVGASGIIVHVATSGGGISIVELNFRDANDTIDCTLINGDSNSSSNEGTLFAYYMHSADANWPGEGAKTLRWEVSDFGEDVHVVVFCVTGSATTGFIIDSDVVSYADPGWSETLPAMTGVGADDLSVVAVWAYNSGTEINTNLNSQTQIYDVGTWSAFSVAYKAAESAMQINCNSYSPCIAVQFSIKAASGGGTSAVPVIMRSYRARRN